MKLNYIPDDSVYEEFRGCWFHENRWIKILPVDNLNSSRLSRALQDFLKTNIFNK